MLRYVRSPSIDEPPCLTQCFLTKSIIQPRPGGQRQDRHRAEAGADKSRQPDSGAGRGGISEEQTILADNRHGAADTNIVRD